MSDNELRDRIADILEELDGMDLDRQAQAIIDEFGLEVETRKLHVGAVALNGTLTDKRVVGKWEKQ